MPRPMIIELTELQLSLLHIKLVSSGLNVTSGRKVIVIFDLVAPQALACPRNYPKYRDFRCLTSLTRFRSPRRLKKFIQRITLHSVLKETKIREGTKAAMGMELNLTL